jgi:crotonobetainyl-CoA:carnitine CoA-transferase CaiB-like acyl-CoA transferase
MNQRKPLAGIRILELGAYISGPYAASLLTALGAEVVKVEPPGDGDAFRRGVDVESHYFVQYNAGKKSLAVNLKSKDGVALIKALVPKFDVFIENSRPGKMAALGLGAAEIQAINPSIVYASVSGFGDGGEWRDRAAYDMIGQSMAGFLTIMNDKDNPRLVGTCVGDLVTALCTAMGILAGLVGRSLDPERRGAEMRTSLLEAMSAVTIDALTQFFETDSTPTRESRHPQAQNFCLQTAGGGAITVHLSSSQKFWHAFTRAMEREDLAQDPRFVGYYERMEHYFALRPLVEAEFLKRTRAEWEERLVRFDVPFAPAYTVAEVAAHPQAEWLGMYERGPDDKMLVRPPWRFGGERPSRNVPAPHIGEHSREVALEVLPAAEVDRLIRQGVLVQHAGDEQRLPLAV